MNSDWHLPTTDCELPAGTKLRWIVDLCHERAGEVIERELLEPCLYTHLGALGIGAIRRKDGGKFQYREAGETVSGFGLSTQVILLPQTEQPKAATDSDIVSIESGQRWIHAASGGSVVVLMVPVAPSTLVIYRWEKGGVSGSVPEHEFLKAFQVLLNAQERRCLVCHVALGTDSCAHCRPATHTVVDVYAEHREREAFNLATRTTAEHRKDADARSRNIKALALEQHHPLKARFPHEGRSDRVLKQGK